MKCHLLHLIKTESSNFLLSNLTIHFSQKTSSLQLFVSNFWHLANFSKLYQKKVKNEYIILEHHM